MDTFPIIMAVRLHQTKIACHKCGEYVYRVFNVIVGQKNEPELDPLCKTCNPKQFFEAAVHAIKIENLQIQSRIVKGREVNKRIIET